MSCIPVPVKKIARVLEFRFPFSVKFPVTSKSPPTEVDIVIVEPTLFVKFVHFNLSVVVLILIMPLLLTFPETVSPILLEFVDKVCIVSVEPASTVKSPPINRGMFDPLLKFKVVLFEI